MFVLVAAAWAHSPHDVVRALGVAGDAVLSGEEVRLVRSSDGGDTLEHLDAPGAFPTCIAALGGVAGGWLMVDDDGVAWRSSDDAAGWSALDLGTAGACAPATDGALLAAGGDLWRVTADDAVGLASGVGSLVSVAEAEDGGWFGVDEAGAYGEERAGAWVTEGFGYHAVAAGDGVRLRGSEVGVERSEDGETWGFVREGATWAIAAGEGAWLAAGLADAVWVSRDRGLTWTLEGDGIEEMSSGSGAPKDGQPHWFALQVAGDTWWAGAWEGLFRRRAGESAWTQLQLRGQPFVRDLAWMGDELLVGVNGGGLARGVPGADGWVDAAPDLGWPWLRAVVPTQAGAGRWFFSGGTRLYTSDDEGRTVQRLDAGLAVDGDAFGVAPGWPDDPRAWAAGQDADGTGAVARTDDGGASWAVHRLDGCPDKPAALAVGTAVTWAACGGRVWRDAGAEVEVAAALDDDVFALLDDEDGVLVGTVAGVFHVEHAGTVAEAWSGARVDSLAREPDGAVLAGTGAGIVRLRPGAAPEALGWPHGDVVVAMDVDAAGRIAVATYGGAFVSTDAGLTWSAATDWDRYDDGDTAFTYTGGWRSELEAGAKIGRARHAAAGDTVRWHVYAAQVRLLGRGDARVHVSVDGAAGRDVQMTRDTLGGVLVETLDEGWHDVEVEVLDGEWVFDGGDRFRHHAPLGTTPDAPPPDGCGCGGGAAVPGLAVWAGAAAWWRRQRRAAAKASTTPSGARL